MTIHLHIPEKWSQVSAEQLRTIVGLTHSRLSKEELLLVLLCRFTGIKMAPTKEDGKRGARTRFRDERGNLFELEAWQVSDFCSRLSFIVEETPRDIVCPYKWNRRLIETSFGDWFQADALMLRYHKTKDTQHMLGAMRSLGDPRDRLTTVDEELMLIWWEDFQQWLIDKYPHVFRRQNPKDEGVISPLETRQNIMLMLNGGMPQENVKIEETNLHDVLSALEHKIEVAEETERMINRRRQ